MERYFPETPLAPPEKRIDAFRLFAGCSTTGAYTFVAVQNERMRTAYRNACRRIAREGIAKMQRELGIPEVRREA